MNTAMPAGAMSASEIQALITLIDDPDEDVYRQVRDRILSLGEPVVPELEQAWEHTDLGDLFRTRIEDILHAMHLGRAFRRLEAWASGGAEDLLEGALAVCSYRYAELDEHRVKARLAALRQDVWLELNDGMTAYEQVRVFNHVFYQVHGFKGNKRHYHAPQNSYLNEVLDSRKGNPLTLGLIYLLVAEDLDLPLRGVNLPNHFILAWMGGTAQPGNEGEALFYVNAFSQGDILGKVEINEFLGKLDIPADPSFHKPCSNLDIIRRLLNNLLNSYMKLNDGERAMDVKRLLTAL
jgi:regulator of sirC expression with transglutaminase-like and TPR domain